ncbi:hypothetical protein TWF718_003683 [Orbilia javanica]|uniref:Uncharacterized protein n=1 Tax=Orbilia javanica TaxID=47235 RepID=A0AAN8MWK1_9PEZI
MFNRSNRIDAITITSKSLIATKQRTLPVALISPQTKPSSTFATLTNDTNICLSPKNNCTVLRVVVPHSLATF